MAVDDLDGTADRIINSRNFENVAIGILIVGEKRIEIDDHRYVFDAGHHIVACLRRDVAASDNHVQGHRPIGGRDNLAGVGIGIGRRGGNAQGEITHIVSGRRERQAIQLLRAQRDAAVGDNDFLGDASTIHIGNRGAGRDIADGHAFQRIVAHIHGSGDIQRDRCVFGARRILGRNLDLGGGQDNDGQYHRHTGVGDSLAGIGIGISRGGRHAEIEIIGVVFGRRDRQAVQLLRRQRDAAIGDGQFNRRAGIIRIGQRGAGGNIADGDALQGAVRDIDFVNGGRNIQRDRRIFIARGILGGHFRRIDGGDHLDAQRHRITGVGNNGAGIGIGVGRRRGDGQIEIIGIVFEQRDLKTGQLLRRQRDAAIGDGQLNRGAGIIRIGQRGTAGNIADGDAL